MNQVSASMEKTLKEFLRDKVVIGSTFAVPLFFLGILPLMYGDIPKEIVAELKGGLTLTMVTFLIMTSGQANLPGSITADEERGLYLKIASMPVRPWKECLGRILAIFIFSLIGITIVLIVGLLYGAQFSIGVITSLKSLGFALLISLTSVGMGLIIASSINGESAATHIGVAITLLTYFLGGMAFSYSSLPIALQIFAKIHPIASANASMIYLLEGEDFVGYNPLNLGQTTLTIALSLIIFMGGLVLYSKRYWRKR